MLEQMRRRTEDIIRYYGELNRRVAHAGTEGIHGLLELSTHLERALAELAKPELDWVSAEIRVLLDQLVHMDAQLQSLRELKMVLEGATHDEGARKRSTH